MGIAVFLGFVAALIIFVSLLASSNPADGATTGKMADDSVSSQGCIGGCLMFPLILIVRPFEFLCSALATVMSADSEEKVRSIFYKAIGSLVAGVAFGLYFYFGVLPK